MKSHPPNTASIRFTRWLRTVVFRFNVDRRGATIIEYALMTSIMAFALMAALPMFSGATGNLYNRVTNAMANTP